MSECCFTKLLQSVYFIWKTYIYFSSGNGQSREPAPCQLYRHTFVPLSSEPGTCVALNLTCSRCLPTSGDLSSRVTRPFWWSVRAQGASDCGPTQNTDNSPTHTAAVKKGKVFPYSLPSVGPGADPGVQAVSPQVTWSESHHRPGSRLPLLSARPAVTSVAFTRRRYL